MSVQGEPDGGDREAVGSVLATRSPDQQEQRGGVAEDPGHVGERDRVTAQRHTECHQHRPQEVRVAFDPLSSVVDQPQAVHQVLRVAKRDEGVVGGPAEIDGVAYPVDQGEHDTAPSYLGHWGRPPWGTRDLRTAMCSRSRYPIQSNMHGASCHVTRGAEVARCQWILAGVAM